MNMHKPRSKAMRIAIRLFIAVLVLGLASRVVRFILQ